jgi:hypothetical protein
VHSWCHGAPGIVLALAGVHALTGSPEACALAEEAAPSIAQLPSASQNVCCGRAGRAQILIELYRLNKRRAHLTAARRVLAEPAPAKLSRDYPRGLYQGALGVTYTEARLADPMRLALPGTGFA